MAQNPVSKQTSKQESRQAAAAAITREANLSDKERVLKGGLAWSAVHKPRAVQKSSSLLLRLLRWCQGLCPDNHSRVLPGDGEPESKSGDGMGERPLEPRQLPAPHTCPHNDYGITACSSTGRPCCQLHFTDYGRLSLTQHGPSGIPSEALHGHLR